MRGKCRICQRTRCTSVYVQAVGEVRHGYATGHIWECIDHRECESVAQQRADDESRDDSYACKVGLEMGHAKGWIVVS